MYIDIYLRGKANSIVSGRLCHVFCDYRFDDGDYDDVDNSPCPIFSAVGGGENESPRGSK